MSANSVQLLQAACDLVGGTKAMAERLGIRESVLLIFIEDRRELPDPLLLRVVDIILAERQIRPRLVQNSHRDNGAALGAGDD